MADLEDDGYWRDVAEAYRETVARGVHYLNDDQVWELAKNLVRIDYDKQNSFDRAKREGRPVADVEYEDYKRRRRESVEKEQN